MPNDEYPTQSHEFQLGDLVKYKYPRRFFITEDEARHIFGVITELRGAFHAKVFWNEDLHCLESFEDLSLLDETN